MVRSAIAVCVCLLLAGCTSVSAFTPTPTPTSPPTATPQPTPTTAPVNTPTATLGSPRSYTNQSTGDTVTIKKNGLDQRGDSIATPTAGDMYQVFYVSIHNQGSVSHSYNRYNFHFVDQNGASYQSTTDLPSKYGPLLHSGSLSPGDTVSGWIAAQIPTTTKELKLQWDDGSSIPSPFVVIGDYTIS
jgi:hypothetical protein